MSEENNPFADKGMNCANCVFFEGGGGCEILNIEVEPMGVCKFWIIPEKNLSDDMTKHETHDQLTHGSWAGEGSSSIASRIRNNLSRYQIQATYGDNYDEGKQAKRNSPRTGQQSYDNYKRQRDKWLDESRKFPDRSMQAENYAGLLAEAQGFMDGFDGKRPIVPIRRMMFSEPFSYEPSGVLKHGEHDQASHGSWAAGSKGKYSAEATKVASQVANKVAEFEPDITSKIKNIAEQVGGTMQGLQHRLKTEESLARKIEADAKDYDGDYEKAGQKVSDAVRYTMTLDSDNYTSGVTKTLDSLRDEGLQVSRVKNFWQKGDDYQGINAKVKHPAGFEFELQFHTPQSLEMKERVHGLYEERRTSSDPKRQYKLYSRTARLVNRLVAPAGILAVGELASNPLILGGKAILIKALSKFFGRNLNV